MRVSRVIDLGSKAWAQGLAALASPGELPKLVRWILVDRVHPGELLSLYPVRRFLRQLSPKTVIDVGANTGQFSSVIGVLAPGARIYAFEPIAKCRQKCTARMRNHPNFVSFNVGVGERAETRLLSITAFTESSSFLRMSALHRRAFPWTGGHSDQQVDVVTLDSLLGDMTVEGPVLLKVDVQGFELPVLRGARKLLESVHAILIETAYQPLYEGQALFGEIHDHLRNEGFRYSGSLQNLIDPTSGLILQADSLFVR